MRILVTGARAPVARHMAWLLKKDGHEVMAADCVRFALTRGGVPTLLHPAPADDFPAFEAWLRNLVVEKKIDLVVPTCEEAIYVSMVKGVPAWTSSPQVMKDLHRKDVFAKRVQECGLKAPLTLVVKDIKDLHHLDAKKDWVFKPVYSRFATNVCFGLADFLSEKRNVSLENPWLAQRRAKGVELCVYACAHYGDVTALQAYRPFVRVGRGAGVALRPVENETLTKAVRQLCARLECHGQVSFDLFWDGQDVTFIECNPRATSGLHFFQAEGFSKVLVADPVTPSHAGTLMVKSALQALVSKSPRRSVALKRGEDVLSCSSGEFKDVWSLMCFAELSTKGWLRGESMLTSATSGIAFTNG